MNAQLELHVRVWSSSLEGDQRLPERHAFPDLTGQLAMAVCATHAVLTNELHPDDETVPMCPLCAVFLMAGGLDVREWKNM